MVPTILPSTTFHVLIQLYLYSPIIPILIPIRQARLQWVMHCQHLRQQQRDTIVLTDDRHQYIPRWQDQCVYLAESGEYDCTQLASSDVLEHSCAHFNKQLLLVSLDATLILWFGILSTINTRLAFGYEPNTTVVVLMNKPELMNGIFVECSISHSKQTGVCTFITLSDLPVLYLIISNTSITRGLCWDNEWRQLVSDKFLAYGPDSWHLCKRLNLWCIYQISILLMSLEYINGSCYCDMTEVD